MKALVLIMVAVWSSLPIIAFGFATSDQDLPAGIISVEPTEETCPEGYDITKDGQDCVRG